LRLPFLKIVVAVVVSFALETFASAEVLVVVVVVVVAVVVAVAVAVAVVSQRGLDDHHLDQGCQRE
jgi:hypothetical protein